ncbi:Crp/Fnr family transcriptional regulator [Desulfogranum mediterraneum]|uniref:Crp/Fnr family transcriptional regulator n=1 Tax=Desulfogranum mediterraneum TaxID=160661 RepID=UPI000421AD81|nr:Crp/Fnr family transcriptional regulator [Desulfogranum mediterraneum]
MNKKIAILKTSMLFSGLSDPQLEALARIARVKSVARGETIFFEGEQANGFYMVARGKVKIFKMSLGGREQILHIFGVGEPFGEVPVFHGNPFPASASTLEASEVLFFPRSEFVELVTTNTSLALSMLAMLSMRLRRFATQVENLTLKEVPGRLASYLLYLVEEQGREDQVILDVPKGQLANLLGSTPETLSRIFAKMKEEGLIQVQGKTIQLLDLEGLRHR